MVFPIDMGISGGVWTSCNYCPNSHLVREKNDEPTDLNGGNLTSPEYPQYIISWYPHQISLNMSLKVKVPASQSLNPEIIIYIYIYLYIYIYITNQFSNFTLNFHETSPFKASSKGEKIVEPSQARQPPTWRWQFLGPWRWSCVPWS